MQQHLLPLLFLLLYRSITVSQAAYEEELIKNYGQYKEPSIAHRLFQHEDIEKIIKELPAPFQVQQAGASVEGRAIYEVTIGNGPVPVLLWSQMHGDEPTATMAIMDLFRFFQADDQFNPLRRELLRKLKLVFIPMLNPDGADCYMRHNAQDIDLNRDALNLESPEARLLKSLQEKWEPEWAFNLHDQNRYYAAGPTGNTAAMSFLAPAYNLEKETNPIRLRAMQLIGLLQAALQQQIPAQVARYKDDFEPRAFGDNFQKWGAATILIESGWLLDDPEKQQLRQLNFVTLLTAFKAIAGQEYARFARSDYEAIPFNEKNAFMDLIIRNVSVPGNGQRQRTDIGFRRDMLPYRQQEIYFDAHLWGMGDLSEHHAYEDFNGAAYHLEMGKVYPEILPDLEALSRLPVRQLWRQGFTAVRVEELPASADEIPCLAAFDRHTLSTQLLEALPADADPAGEIRPGQSSGLLLKKNDRVEFVIIKGRLLSL